MQKTAFDLNIGEEFCPIHKCTFNLLYHNHNQAISIHLLDVVIDTADKIRETMTDNGMRLTTGCRS
jgi:hypothetical protein